METLGTLMMKRPRGNRRRALIALSGLVTVSGFLYLSHSGRRSTQMALSEAATMRRYLGERSYGSAYASADEGFRSKIDREELIRYARVPRDGLTNCTDARGSPTVSF